jgi:hypothetical protein
MKIADCRLQIYGFASLCLFYLKKYFTAETAKNAEVILIFFLSVLCDLCGEIIVSFAI